MIIENSVIRLDYDPVTDILRAEWPDVREYTVGEAVYAMDAIVSAMRLYDIKFLLADTRSVVIDIPELRYKEILLNFTKSLAGTRAQKLARVVSDISLRERIVSEVKREAQFKGEVRSFTNKNDAANWLSQK